MTHVVVVGAGPAGLAAAAAALRHGATVTVVDLAERPGGQIDRMLPDAFAARTPQAVHHGWRAFRRRAAVLDDCTWRPETAVWAVEPRPDRAPLLHVLRGRADGSGRDNAVLDADAVVFATGAHDRVLPFPGWTLPGVYTAGAAQALVKGERLVVGERLIVAGSGPFLLPVAHSLAAEGARVLAVLEASTAAALARGWLRRPWQLAGHPDKLVELGRHASSLARRRTPYRPGHAVVAARGDGRVEEVVVARVDRDWAVLPGSETTVPVDAVCVSHAFTPQVELPVAAGCVLRDGFVAVDGRQQTTVPGVYAAGEITGIAGAPAATAEGTVAGTAAANAVPTPAALRARDRHRRFAERLAAAHRVGDAWPGWLTDDTIVCRCESTPLRLLRDQPGTASPRAVRLGSRAGLGPCQGRMCGATVAELTGQPEHTDHPGDRAPRWQRRPVAQPVRLGELAGPPGRTETT